MAKEARKAQRGGRRGSKDSLPAPHDLAAQAESTQALNAEAQRGMLLRIGLITAGVWVVCGLIAAVSQSTLGRTIPLGVALVITLGLGWLLVWAQRRSRSAQGVAGILAGIRSDEDREAALAKLDSDFKPNDAAAIFAKAQLLMQTDPKAALTALETIDLQKSIPTVADEARAQRGMLHLMLGEPSPARDLADGIDLSRHQDSRSKAMMASVIAEAWARTGQAKKAAVVIEVFKPEDELFEQVRPQLYRARAFVYAYQNNPKAMKQALRRLVQIDARLLGSLLTKRTHPLLQKEARLLLEQSGQVQRKVQFQRG